jgi:hypothetical protein
MRRVYECLTFDTASATCTQAAWLERSDFPTLTTAEAFELLTSIMMLFVVVWGWRQLGRQTGPRG